MSAPPAVHAVINAVPEHHRRGPEAGTHIVLALDVAGYDISARPPTDVSAFTRRPLIPTSPPVARPLTAGQREVLLLIAADMSNADIASHLWLSETAVKARVKTLFGALGVGTRLDAVLTAVELGHVTLGDLLVARADRAA
ncbi:MAG TPA: LuxR C-terminal-related transcriptional regulator [Phytomonospora sp.]